MFTFIIAQSKSKVNTNIKIAIDDRRMILPLIRDLILRCPYFCSPALISFGAKIRPLQLKRLAVSAPDGARWLPPSRARFQILTATKQKSRTSYDFFVLKTNPNFDTNAHPSEVRGCKVNLGGVHI